MKRLSVLLIFPFLFGCASKKEAEWVSLFNGKNLDNWQVMSNPKDSVNNVWRVNEDYIQGIINKGDHDYVWLMSEKEYKDFSLKFKFAISDTVQGNTGVQFHSRYDADSSWLDGPQIDIEPRATFRIGMIWDETRGNRRWLYPDLPKGEWVNKDMRDFEMPMRHEEDEEMWNDMLIDVSGYLVKAWLNGTEVTNYNGEGVLNDSIHSKHNVGSKGYIAFQVHQNNAMNIKLKDIFIKEN